MKIFIEGMSCMHCAAHVKEALEAIGGLSNIQVSLEDKWATADGTAPEAAIKSAIEEEGYEVRKIEA